MDNFPWIDDDDTGYTVEPYDPERDEAPEGSPRDCHGEDLDGGGE